MPQTIPGAIALVGGLSAGATVISGSMGSSAARSAAASQSAASERASQAQLEAAHIAAGATREAASKAASATIEAARLNNIGIERAVSAQEAALAAAAARNAPYEKAGRQAMKSLQALIKAGPGEFEESPGYQFRLGEGNKNLLAQASAAGGLASGRTLKALEAYGQDYASYEYDKFIGRYYQQMEPLKYLTGIGQAAAARQSYNDMSAGANISNLYQQQGATNANAQTGLANIYSGLGNSLAGIAMNRGEIIGNNYMNQGNIAANSSINQANAWTGAINQGLGTFASFAGNQNWGSGGGSSSYTNPGLVYPGSTVYNPAFSSGYAHISGNTGWGI